MNDNISELKETEQAHESSNNRFFAIVLILVGTVLIINNLTDYSFENWWALFMLIPVGFIFTNIWRDYQENGRLTRQSSGAIIPGVVMLAMIAIFLFNLSWTIFWPVAIIAVGLSILLGSR
jgi:surface polysaccharide O-acyltransferase-like enzyme